MTERRVVGVTGRYCAGKDTLVKALTQRGYSEINVDQVGHEVLARLGDAVARRFGEGVRREDGTVDRRRLGEIVFADRDALRDLEDILHPAMVAKVHETVAASTVPVVINAAILHRMGLHRLCDLVICVTAPALQRFKRARARDGLTVPQALRRLSAQRGICPKRERDVVDTIRVGNTGSPAEMLARLGNIIPDFDSKPLVSFS